MRNRTKASFWIVAVFLAGSVFGGTLTYFWASHPTSADNVVKKADDRHESPKEKEAKTLAYFSEMLQLDEAQTEQLRLILERSRQRYREAHQAKEARFKSIRAETRDEIRSILRTDQLEKFEAWRQERDRKRHDNKKGGC